MVHTRRSTGRRGLAALAGGCVAVCLVCVLAVASVWRPGAPASRAQGDVAPRADAPAEPALTSEDATSADALAAEPRAWSEQDAPNYYEVVGPARIGGELEPGTVEYASLDGLGRATQVRACVDAELAEAGSSRSRDDMSDLEPSGWGHNREASIELPTGKVYNGHFWNRSHLLAKSLGGAETLQNLVCGTRMQNVGANVGGVEGGMAYPETLARTWLYEHPDGFVRYEATPVYHGDEPVCRCVLVDVLSSDGTLDKRVVVYNAAKGYTIDYQTGDFHEC